MSFFSVIIPSYNRGAMLPNVIGALLSQTFSDFEIIIVDDGSTDNTKDIIERYLVHSQIKYIYQQNKGVSVARNTGAVDAKGVYLVFLDSDDDVEDSWLTDFFSVLKDGEFDIAYCNLKMIKSDGSVTYVSAFNPYGNNKGFGLDIPGSWAIKKNLFYSVGMYDANIKFSENNELRLRLKLAGAYETIVNKYNFIYNISTNGGSKNYRNKINSILYILEKHKNYYDANKITQKKFMQVAAVSAARIGEYKLAHKLFSQTLVKNRSDIKLWVQFFISTSNFLSRLKWPNK